MPLRWTEAHARQVLGTGRVAPSTSPSRARTGYPCTRAVHLVLPYPPLNNRYYRHVDGRVLLSTAGRTYRALVAEVVRVGWPVGLRKPFDNQLFLTVTLHVPSNRHRPDADAVLKGPFDALTYAGVYLDDKLIHDFLFRKREPRPPYGCIEIGIEPYQEDHA